MSTFHPMDSVLFDHFKLQEEYQLGIKKCSELSKRVELLSQQNRDFAIENARLRNELSKAQKAFDDIVAIIQRTEKEGMKLCRLQNSNGNSAVANSSSEPCSSKDDNKK